MSIVHDVIWIVSFGELLWKKPQNYGISTLSERGPNLSWQGGNCCCACLHFHLTRVPFWLQNRNAIVSWQLSRGPSTLKIMPNNYSFSHAKQLFNIVHLVIWHMPLPPQTHLKLDTYWSNSGWTSNLLVTSPFLRPLHHTNQTRTECYFILLWITETKQLT